MKQSLRQKLNDLIKARGKVSYNEIKEKCESGYFGAYYRMETADRRLRKSESPNIEPIIEKGYITGWEWAGKNEYQTYKVLDDNGQVEKVLKMPI